MIAHRATSTCLSRRAFTNVRFALFMLGVWPITAVAGTDRFTPSAEVATTYRHGTVADPVVPGVVYMAGPHGVILRTRDDGASWTELSVGSDQLVQAIAVTRGGTILALGSTNHGSFLLTSIDGGLTWSGKAIRLASDLTPADLVVDPHEARTAYIATSRNIGSFMTEDGPVFKTMDGGDRWSETASLNLNVYGRPRLGAASLEHHPLLSGVVYAERSTLLGVSVTTTGGTAWRSLSVPVGIVAVAMDALYGSSLFGVPAAAYKSTNGGETWENLGLVSADYVTIAAHPTVSGVVAVSVDRLSPDASGTGTFHSSDGGRSWTDISNATDREGASFRIRARRLIIAPSGTIFASHVRCDSAAACGTFVYTPVGPRRRAVRR